MEASLSEVRPRQIGTNLSDTTSKKSRKKAEKLKQRLQKKRQKRREEKVNNRSNRRSIERHDHVSKKEEKRAERLKLEQVLRFPDPQCLKVCFDLQYENLMNNHELTHLARQLGRIYGFNKSAANPAMISLASLPDSSETFKLCQSKSDGFANYIWQRSQKPLLELFRLEDLVYLSPDSDQVLEDVDLNKVYVIGGLIDRTVQKKSSLNFSDLNGLKTARLPIEKYCDRLKTGTFKQILTINQVFEILLKYCESKNWASSLRDSVPTRTGFVPKETDQDENLSP